MFEEWVERETLWKKSGMPSRVVKSSAKSRMKQYVEQGSRAISWRGPGQKEDMEGGEKWLTEEREGKVEMKCKLNRDQKRRNKGA